MIRTLVALCTLCCCWVGFAQEKPRTLPAKDAAAGMLMLFDGASTFGWTTEGGATMSVKDGKLELEAIDKPGWVYFTTRLPESLELVAEWRGRKTQLWFLGSGEISTSVGDDTTPHTRLQTNRTGRTYSLRSQYRVKPDADPIKGGGGTVKDCDPGPIRIGIQLDVGGSVSISQLDVLPSGNQALFNGKNLDGWKVNAADPKRMTSQFTVTKDGELSVKNGPGDLATEKEFDNFLLQLECKTLGKGLNSGIFFRSIPGQYQNGYEAQIQNLFKGGDRTKPFDYGTGAIYRRIAARKVVSDDNEWFTLTVLADRKRIATWVNGYQTVDWTDERPANDNPRQGYRAAKGVLSIQGHDPTTDLLFRNMRITELSGK